MVLYLHAVEGSPSISTGFWKIFSTSDYLKTVISAADEPCYTPELDSCCLFLLLMDDEVYC